MFIAASPLTPERNFFEIEIVYGGLLGCMGRCKIFIYHTTTSPELVLFY